MNKPVLSFHNLNVQTIPSQQLAAIKGGNSFDDTEDQGKHKTGAQ